MTPAQLRALSDDELRALLRGYALDDVYLDELCRRIPAIGILRTALHAAMEGDEAAYEAEHGWSLTMDPPQSSGTRAVRDLYQQALTSWLDGAPQLVTKHQAAEILGMDNPDSAARKLARWDVHPVGYTGGRRPEALYPRHSVEEQAAVERRPGRRRASDET